MVCLVFGEIGPLWFWLFVIKCSLARSHRSSLKILYATIEHLFLQDQLIILKI